MDVRQFSTCKAYFLLNFLEISWGKNQILFRLHSQVYPEVITLESQLFSIFIIMEQEWKLMQKHFYKGESA